MRKMLQIIYRSIVRWMVKRNIVWPIVWVYSIVIKEVTVEDWSHSNEKPTILAINANRFRKDLEILSNTKQFKILSMPFKWQQRLLSPFWTKPFPPKRYHNPDPQKDQDIIAMQQSLRSFFRKFLPLLFKQLKIDCVIGAAIHYKQDYDFGFITHEIGVPFIVLHKENFAASQRLVEGNYNRSKNMGRFKGTHIIVHNEIMKDIFIRSGFVKPVNISALGCLRMDDYIRKVKQSNIIYENHMSKKRVALFYFQHGVGLSTLMGAWSTDGKTGFIKLFEDAHMTIARLASRYSDIEFVIKAKWGGEWVDRIKDVILKNNINPDSLKNLIITSERDAQEIILQSDVICGFGSTTILEAAITGKPVIIPFFDEAVMTEYSDSVILKDDLHHFDVAGSPAEFEEMIIKRIHDPSVDPFVLKERERLFERYVSCLAGNASERYVNLIADIIHQSRKSCKNCH